MTNRDALIRTALVALAALPLSVLTAPAAHAQRGDLLAPPVSRYDDRIDDQAYLWRDLPERERIPIERASFDREGYRLIDDRGQSIVVPFEGNNLYVMRFGRTSGGMYFVNEDGVPTLYVSSSDYLENRQVAGARWYPFPRNYDYVRPVYLGVAPTWNDYCDMGWYPGMVSYGGWYDYRPWSYGITFRPTNGLYISIGSRSWSRWDDFCGYYRYTPYQRVVIVNSPRYYPTTVIRTGGYRRDDDWNRGRNDSNRGDYRGGYSRDGGNRGGAERFEPQKDRIVRNGEASRYDGSGRSGGSDRTGGSDRYSRDGGGTPRDTGRYDNSGRTGGSSGRTGSADSGRTGGFDRGSSGRSSSDAGRSSGSDRARSSSGSDRGRSSDTGRSSGGGRSSSSRDRESGRQGR